jgi:protein-disulfide isomerase
MEQFVNTGKVRFEFHQFPLQQHYPGALQAAMASLCVADQNEFWPYHDRVFQAATARGQAGTEVEALIGYASELGIDADAVRTCMNNLTHQQTVLASLEQARALGLSSTPSILVDGQLVANPFNFNALAQQIEEAIAAKAGS